MADPEARADDDRAASDSLFHLRRATYEPLIDTRFEVHAGDRTIAATLVEVTDLTDAHSGRTAAVMEEAFSLVFASDDEYWLPQGTYDFDHETLERFSLFVVPVGRRGTTYLYEAVINRLSE